MVAEIILVLPGSEADGARQSAQYVARGLSAIGYKVREQISVCETVGQLQQAVASALARSHVLVTLGGLGKEAAHMTKTTLASGLGLPLELNNEALTAMRSYCHRTGEPYSLEDNALAQLPKGSVAFPGGYGKIPGCVISSSKQHIILLPETQAEIIPMFNKYVSPYLGGTATTTVTRTVRTYGVGEQGVRETLSSMLSASNPAVTIQREQNEVLIRVTAHGESGQQAAALCTPVLRTIVDKMGDAAYGLDVDSLQSAVIAKLNKKELDIAVAEAGTSGMLTRVLTETEGGQDILRYSVAVDEDSAKAEKLGLKPKLLKKRGSISEYAAVAMASAAREKVHTGIGVAICAATEETATKKCPPGLAYIAVCDAEYVYVKKLVIGDGDVADDVIIDATLSRALNMVRLFVDYLPGRYTGAIPLMEALDGKTVTDKDSYDDGLDGDDSPGEDGDKTDRKAGKREIVRKFIFTLAVIVFLGSAIYIGYTMLQSYKNAKLADELNNMFAFGEMGDVEVSPDYPSDYSLKFAGLWNVNPDVRAFIKIDDTSVKYPIVQAGDHDFYLRRDFYKQPNQHGVPFFDFRVDVARPSDNMVVYGHNMTDGQIFGELVKYNKLEYYQEHPVIDFSTVYGDGQYKIFSIFITNAYTNQGHVFDYYNFIQSQSDEQFASFLEQLKYRTIINTTVDAQPGDKLITLSTCTYEFKDARLVVVARKLRPGEDASVNVDDAVRNPQPLYPDVWYSAGLGGTKPSGINSDWSVGNSASDYVGYAGDETAPAAVSEAPVSTASEAPASSAPPPSSTAPSSSKAASSSRSSSASASEEEEDSLAEELAARAESRRAESSRAAEESRKAAAEESRKAAEAAAASSKAASDAAAAEAAAASSKAASDAAAAEAAAASSKAASDAAAAEAAAASSKAASDAAAAEAAAALAAQQAQQQELQQQASRSVSGSGTGEITVISGGKKITADALDIIAGVVQTEVGPTFNTEAIKAQAVASYTYIEQTASKGTTPTVNLSAKIDPKVEQAVAEVIGEAVYYKNQLAFTPYHATSAGATTSSTAVWGGSYPYLVSVDSSVDQKANGYKTKTTMTSGKVADLLSSRLGIDPDGDPGNWFEILDYVDGDYVGNMAVCGETKSAKSGSRLTGRLIRETVLNLRSANFTVDYDPGSDKFTFTTYGYGHGVGMSQNGANAYAAQGWNYLEILEHYYPGTTVM